MTRVKIIIVYLIVLCFVHSCSNSNNYKQFVGTYQFDYYENDGTLWNCPKIVVLEDGRCIKVSSNLGGEKITTCLGQICTKSKDAFYINGSTPFILRVNLYQGREEIGYTNMNMEWYPRQIVFDVKEGRLYLDWNEYENRDVTNPIYTKMFHSLSTSL